MWSTLKKKIIAWRGVMITAPSMVALTIATSATGLFQIPELTAFDYFISLRPLEKVDPNISIVIIDESDLYNYNFPIPDDKLAQAIKIIKKQKPRVIGLDIYRDMPVEPGHQELVNIFTSTNNLIGIEKTTNLSDGKSVKPPHNIPQDRVALADVIQDSDGKVRRALLSIEREDGKIQLGLGTQAALMYLADEGIFLEQATKSESEAKFKLGKAIIKPFSTNDGGYVNEDAGGYQILLNYRGCQNQFQTATLTEVLQGKIPSNWATNRVVLIGSTAESLNDKFSTPYNIKNLLRQAPGSMAGVIIHANIASQIINAAYGRPLIKVVPEFIEWIWIVGWGLIGSSVSWLFFKRNLLNPNVPFLISLFIISIIIPSGVLATLSYLAFLQGWWLPVFTPFIALSLSALTMPHYKNYELNRMASSDGLTQIANRRYFDEYYLQIWQRLKETKQPLSLILCDIDYFKFYNDNYGHQAGDRCLQQVAQAISKSIRTTDLVARYGGEEFIIVLPSTDKETAFKIGQRICFQVQNLQIPHSKSKVSHIVTISCGVATLLPHKISTHGILIASADSALYAAKEKGRNCVFVR